MTSSSTWHPRSTTTANKRTPEDTLSPMNRAASTLTNAHPASSQITIAATSPRSPFDITTADSTPQPPSEAESFKRVCYYDNRAQYAPTPTTFWPENIDPNLCSHLVYASATVEKNKLKPLGWNDKTTPWSTGMYERFNNLKKVNSDLKTLLSVGGRNIAAKNIVALLSSSENRQEFVNTSITFLRQMNFDGLDLDFSRAISSAVVAVHKRNFTLLCGELFAAFEEEALSANRHRLILSVAVALSKNDREDKYTVSKIASYMDFVSIKTYNLHGSSDGVVGHTSALFPATSEKGDARRNNVDWIANRWVQLGVPRSKVVIGIASYGQGFALSNPLLYQLGSVVWGPSLPGPYTMKSGVLAFHEVCSKLKRGIRVWNIQQKVPFVKYGGNQLVGYDDQESLAIKVAWLRRSGFGGWMFSDLHMDDATGRFCGLGRFPLLKTLYAELLRPIPTMASLKWTESNRNNSSAETTTMTAVDAQTDAAVVSPVHTESTTTAPEWRGTPSTGDDSTTESEILPSGRKDDVMTTASPGDMTSDAFFDEHITTVNTRREVVESMDAISVGTKQVSEVADELTTPSETAINSRTTKRERVTTTSPPSETTRERVTTTAPPSETTRERVTTTSPPSETTRERVTTTSPPSETTRERITTTSPPSETSSDPPVENQATASAEAVSGSSTPQASNNVPEFSCLGKSNGIYSNPTDCHGFYYCAWGKKHPVPCQTGLVFDPTLQVCNWPALVNRDC